MREKKKRKINTMIEKKTKDLFLKIKITNIYYEKIKESNNLISIYEYKIISHFFKCITSNKTTTFTEACI